MSIYTKTGDEGETGLLGGMRVSKDDLRVKAYGDVDELNAFLGQAAAQAIDSSLAEELVVIQRDLFALGAELATPSDVDGATRRITPDRTAWVEDRIDRYEVENTPLTKFILPGGAPGAVALQICRAVCRRAERSVVSLARAEGVNPDSLVFLNRLSDLLFVMARWTNRREGGGEAEWD